MSDTENFRTYLNRVVKLYPGEPENADLIGKNGTVLDYDMIHKKYTVKVVDEITGKATLVKISRCEFSLDDPEECFNIFNSDMKEELNKLPENGYFSEKLREVITPALNEIQPVVNISADDPVNHPSHYTDGKIEVIDFIENQRLNTNFYLSNAVKYISRAGKKDAAKETEDLEKAVWYLRRMESLNTAAKDPFVDEYIQDKNLTGLKALALKIICIREPGIAADALELYIQQKKEAEAT